MEESIVVCTKWLMKLSKEVEALEKTSLRTVR